ncbi:LOW QUALITY PROTEIN: hypothetical protein PanWU01x14_154150, partial [Parasponia andersonii]
FEKERGRLFRSNKRNLGDFVLFDFGAIDLGFAGNSFTWNNRQDGTHIRECIDRAICSTWWKLLYKKPGVVHLTMSSLASNQCPIY